MSVGKVAQNPFLTLHHRLFNLVENTSSPT